jgi:transcriptional regulator with XRE-family HTH domain
MKEWRAMKGLTLEQLAERIGIEYSYLSKIERGERPYNQRTLENIARGLETTAAALLVQHPEDSEGIWAIAEKIHQLPPPARRQAIRVLDALARTGLANE